MNRFDKFVLLPAMVVAGILIALLIALLIASAVSMLYSGNTYDSDSDRVIEYRYQEEQPSVRHIDSIDHNSDGSVTLRGNGFTISGVDKYETDSNGNLISYQS